ncbi:sensor histidine kinase [Ferroacidibacillus organovorans]|uniref:histidine kinase n=1 Tax=Ferroacidibacillus organovorans TaxID=1765683 RepID=A0A853KC11_9BACL|nr:HAMP domain-containing sensor histidine kinase [Ferroacidibacillus organovorans]KYP82033.1 hypothetical protein AYJ22_04850 [Ferroacidibacillus organovorans]OAG94353.1 hypothetical protein AYW79_05670 [Ferroacidibacillus organovorans]
MKGKLSGRRSIGFSLRMRMPIAIKVVVVYLVIVMISLALAGYLTNRSISQYVIDSTRNNLIGDGQVIIKQFRAYGQTLEDRHATPPTSRALVTIAAQSVQREYIIVDPNGNIVWNTFTAADLPLLQHVSTLVAMALKGRHTASGVYPQQNPIFEFVAIPFSYAYLVPVTSLHPGFPPSIMMPNLTIEHRNTKVLVLFTKLSDMKRITYEIWVAVAQGLMIATLITAIVGIVLARSLMQPAGLLKQAIMRVQERDFTHVPVVHTGDEWEDFAYAFNNMVDALKAFDEGQKRFLQNASHELKTPLIGIRGYAEGLRDGVFEPSESMHILDIIAAESVRLKRLVDELIYLSKLETLDDVYTFTHDNLTKIITKTIERAYPLARERQIQIVPDLPEGIVLAYIDSDKIVQALLNLIGNAIRHAHSRVIVTLRKEEFAKIVVEDDGEGFVTKDVERVFERFFHGDKGETGLGLSIVRAIVEKHRGKITAENGSMGGAKFTIELP